MNFSICKKEGCQNHSVYGSDFCYDHTEDKEALKTHAVKFISANKVVKGYNFSKIPLQGLDFSGKDLSYTIFSECDLTEADFKRSVLISSFFDFSILNSCDFSYSQIKFSVFGGASMVKTKIVDTVASFCNFLGADLTESNFNNSDLSHSRFICCGSAGASFFNCNLKRTIFQNLIFKMKNLLSSNYQDAVIKDCRCSDGAIEDILK